MEITLDQLKKLLPKNERVAEWHQALVKFLPQYDINTTQRIAAFISQCAHESADFTVLKENLNYGAEGLRKTFSKYFPTDALAQAYARQPQKIANRVYANRMGNGDEASGDGWRYCGRGLIQITGKTNYSGIANYIGKPLDQMTDYMTTIDGAVQSACWFWKTNNINQFADKGDVVGATKKINGGTNGLEDRQNKYKRALQVLGG